MEEYEFTEVDITEMSDEELDDIVGGVGAVPGVCCAGVIHIGPASCL